jgi:hypothetical protein
MIHLTHKYMTATHKYMTAHFLGLVINTQIHDRSLSWLGTKWEIANTFRL